MLVAVSTVWTTDARSPMAAITTWSSLVTDLKHASSENLA